MKQYLLFDLDGTLTDPKIGITSSVQYALQFFGIEEPDLDKLEPFIGPPLMESFQEFYQMNEEQALTAVAKYRERFEKVGLYENEVYAGIPQMLQELKRKGLHLAIASSKPTVFVERILEHFGIRQYFEVVVGSELDGRRTQKSEVVQEALRLLFQGENIRRDQVYMIGDRKFDVEGAKALGVESVGVAYGYGGMEELKEAHADYIVRTVEELRDFLLRGFDDEGSGWNGAQKIGALLMPFLLFQAVRFFTQYLAYGLLLCVRGGGAGAAEFWNGTETAAEYSGNFRTMVSALGFALAALAIARPARAAVRRTAQEMYLTHLKEIPKSDYVWAAVSTLGFTVGLNLWFAITGFTELSADYVKTAQNQYSVSVWVGLVCYGLLSPFCEELLFRGVLYHYMRCFFSLRTALFLSAGFFAIYHMNVVQGVYAFLMGMFLTYGYEYFGSFKAPVLIHMFANLSAYLLHGIVSVLPGLLNETVSVFCLALGVTGMAAMARQKKIYI